jgi:GxxExxY protein
LPVRYRGIKLDAGYRIDLLVADTVVVEVKSVECLLPVHRAQLLAYLRLSGNQLGLLLNFNVPRLRHGTIRMVN